MQRQKLICPYPSTIVYSKMDESFLDLNLEELQNQYRVLLGKYNKLNSAAVRKLSKRRQEGKYCCSCSTKFTQQRTHDDDYGCNRCNLWPCVECMIECPKEIEGCILCKSCEINNTFKCTNCITTHCKANGELCESCFSRKCLTCETIGFISLNKYGECETCSLMRQKLCGGLFTVWKRKHRYLDDKYSPGCMVFGDKTDAETGLCNSCLWNKDHTCLVCKEVKEDVKYGECLSCIQKAKCSHCNQKKSENETVAGHHMCDKCFIIFEKCGICNANLAISPAHKYYRSSSHLSAIKGESKCHDCYTSKRHK